MSIRVKLSSDEMRARIVDVAEEQFRRVGYAKTAVADLAAALGMSSANIYRFFASKSAINNAICEKMLADAEEMAIAIVRGPGTAAERLTHLMQSLHDYNKSRCTDEHRIHDMVEMAMAERWPAIEEHCDRIGVMIGMLLSEGQEAGEFTPMNVEETAETIFCCCCSFFHPTMIAQCAGEDQQRTLRNMSAFILRALTNSAPQSSPNTASEA